MDASQSRVQYEYGTSETAPRCGSQGSLSRRTALGGGTAKDQLAIAGNEKLEARHELPQPQKENLEPAYQRATTESPMILQAPIPQGYGNKFQTYDLNQLILQQQQDLTKRVNTLDITTLGWSPM